MDFGDPIFLFLFIEVIVVLALLGFFLRKPRLAVVPAPPYAVRRDLAYRIRSIGYPVEVAKDVLRIRVDSLAALKLHVRDDPGGTSIRYEVDATTTGWAIVLILALSTYAGLIALIVALVIHFRARRFARSRVVPLLAQAPPLGTLQPPDVRSMLLEGASEAYRLASEAYEYEKEATQNAIGILLLLALALWLLVYFVGLTLPLPVPNPGFAAFLLASVWAIAAASVGSWVVLTHRKSRVAELEQEMAFYRSAWQTAIIGAPGPGGPQGSLELLLRAAFRSPHWREIRRRRRLWHDPLAGFVVFFLGYTAILFSFLAIVGDVLAIEWRVGLGVSAAVFGIGGIWFLRSWIRTVREQDERDKRDWENRRVAIEAELWRMLTG